MPAQSDPRFADRPPGYLTTSPGWRDDIFYYEPGTDPRVVSVDEATKETGTSGELATYETSFAYSAAIRVPVLVVVGEHDGIICSPFCQQAAALEPRFYSPEAHVEVVLIPAHGHNLNLERGAAERFRLIRLWADREVGRTSFADGHMIPLRSRHLAEGAE